MTTNVSIAATRSPVEPMSRSLGGERYVLRLWCALGTLAVALLANELVTVRTIKAAVLASAPNAPVASLGQNAWHVLRASWQTVLGPADLAIALVIGAALLYIVHTERRHAAATELLWRAEHERPKLHAELKELGDLPPDRLQWEEDRLLAAQTNPRR